jgi:polyisoprenyl-teichoic acid--peptidoglycan teichoic acid transferase
MSSDRWDDRRHEAPRPARPRTEGGGRGPLSYGANGGAVPPRRAGAAGGRGGRAPRADRGVGRDGRSGGGGDTGRRAPRARPPEGDTRRVRVGDPFGASAADPWSEPQGAAAMEAGPQHARHGGGGGRDGGGYDDDGDGGGRRRRSWPQRLILSVGAVLVLICMLGASVAGYALVLHNRIDRVKDLDLPSAAAGEPENFLVVAVDTREGQGSMNTDTIMVVRIDPESDRLALTSFPRDLMVTVADTGELGQINAAYARADGSGPHNLIQTLQQNFGIQIHHFVEVNFESFKQVVDAVGGVSLWMEQAARDEGSGFYNEQLGCVQLDGEAGLEFVRSRKLEILVEDDWEHDPLSDVNRVRRQQIFIQRAMAKVLSQVRSNPLRLQELVNIGVNNIVLDPNLTLGDLKDLGDHFKDFDPSQLETYPLPTEPWPEDENRLVLNDREAEPLLNVFRGLPPGEIGPPLIDVQVLNGTVADEAQKREGLATDVSGALQQVGFNVAEPGDVSDQFYAQTTIQHAPDQAVYAQRVARHITSDHAIPTEANPDLAPGQVVVIAGADFSTVHEQATPIEAMPAPAGAQPAGGAPAEGSGGAGGSPDTTAATPPTTAAERPPTPPTTEDPFIIGAVPEGQDC